MFKKLIILTSLTTIFTAPLMTVACSSSGYSIKLRDNGETLSPFFYGENEIDWNESYWEAEINYWNDGDTVSFKNIDLNTPDASKVDTSERIRVEQLDTPEMGEHIDGGYVESKGLERFVAEKATEYARKIMPTGSKFRAWYGGQDGYSRNLAALFFKDENNNWRSFATEMFWQGLAWNEYTVSDVNSSSNPLFADTNSVESLTYTSMPNLLAWKNAQKDKIGMHKYDLLDVYKIRGFKDVRAIDDTSLSAWEGVLGEESRFKQDNWKEMFDEIK